MKYEHFRNIIHDAINRFAVMQIDDTINEVSHRKVDEWIERNYPEEETFTVEEIKKYLQKSDSLGDALYYANRIREKIEEEEEDTDDE